LALPSLHSLHRSQAPTRCRRFQAGILECRGGQNVGFVVGSVTSLECVFQGEGRRPEPYIATVRRYGPGYRLHRSDPVFLGGERTDHQDWTRRPSPAITVASAPTHRSGLGGGGNFLVGGPQNSYALQPISVQGQTGLNVAAGVADIELQPVRFCAWRSSPAHASPSPPPLKNFKATKEARSGGPLFCWRHGSRHPPNIR